MVVTKEWKGEATQWKNEPGAHGRMLAHRAPGLPTGRLLASVKACRHVCDVEQVQRDPAYLSWPRLHPAAQAAQQTTAGEERGRA